MQINLSQITIREVLISNMFVNPPGFPSSDNDA